MPDLYEENTYDLAGFSVGIVEENEILGREKVDNGDILIGLFSSGIHSNGYTFDSNNIEYSIIGEIVESKGSDEKVIINGINS